MTMASQIQHWADSAGLKVAQYVVTGMLVPAAIWLGSRVLDDLDKIKTAQQTQAIQAAELVLKVQALERAGLDRQTALNVLREEVIKQGYEIRRLDERGKNAR